MHAMIRSTDKSKKEGPLGGEDSDARMVRSRFSKSSSADSASTDMQEESSPWRSLPSDILERAFALLPLPDFFRVCCVCKRWNALIHCAEFWCRVAWGPFYVPQVRWDGRGSRTVPWSSYDLGERKWIPMPPFEFPLQNPRSGWSLMAANGGLVCFRSLDGLRTLVCNPLTNTWKELPPQNLDSRYMTISYMIVDEQRNSYKILLAGNATYRCSDSRYGTVDLYDSMTKTWSIGQSMSVGSLVNGDGAYCGGEFYILTQRSWESPYVVEILDLTMLRWREETISIPEGFKPYPCIVACLGQIYLVGESNDIDSYPFRRVVIFQLDQSNRWTKVSEFSDEQGLIQGCGSNGSKIHVVTNPGFMWITVYDCATSCWEEPIRIGEVLAFQDIFETKFTFHPNYRVAP